MEADGDADRAEVAFEGKAVLLEPGVGIGLDEEVQIVGPPVLPTGNERGAAAENQVLFPAEMGGEMHPCPVQKRGGSTGQVHSGHGLGFAVGPMATAPRRSYDGALLPQSGGLCQ